MDKLRIVLAGAGLIGRRHAQLLAASPRACLAAVADPGEAARAFARGAGVPHFDSLQALFAAVPGVDGAILATPNALHVQGAMECAAHGIGALIEKPVADSLPEGRRLLQALRDGGVPMLVGHHRRHSAVLQAARAAIAQGRLGRIVSVLGSAQFHKPQDYFDAAPWRSQAGGGPVLINLIHEMDNLRYLCGEVVGVQAMASDAVRGFAVEDTVVIGLRFASGALGSFALSDTAACPWSWEHTSGENADYPRHADQDCYWIAGTRGSLAVPTLRSWRYEGEASWRHPFSTHTLPLSGRDPLQAQLDHFCDVLQGKAAPLVSVEDAMRSLEVVDAVQRAIASGVLVAPSVA